MRSGCGLSRVRVVPLNALLSTDTSERYSAGCPAPWGSICEVSTLACNNVPTGNWFVSIRVRAATLALKACCRLIARSPEAVWLTATLLPRGNG